VIRIDRYLTQRKLASALAEIVGEDWFGSELKLPDSRRRWDMAFCTDGHTTVVEYDGDAHYRDPLKIKIDSEKDAIAESLEYTVVRIPYWIQLDSEMLLHYFGITAVIQQDFPHGFITTKLFPASYCEMGISRFRRELQSLQPVYRMRLLHHFVIVQKSMVLNTCCRQRYETLCSQ